TSGKQLGIEDERDLWPRACAAVERYAPACVFLENVDRFAVWDGLGRVDRDLRSLGYVVTAGLFSAKEVGATQKRLRAFIMAVRDGRRGERRSRDGRNDHQRVAARRSRPEPGGLGPTVVGAGGAELEGTVRTRRGRAEPSDADRELGVDTSFRRGEGRAEHEGRSGLSSPSERSGTVARPGHGARCAEQGVELQGRGPGAGQPGQGLPLSPPGPGLGGAGVLDQIGRLLERDPGAAWRRYQAELAETLEWRELLRQDLDLAPAFEPELCRVADGVADRTHRIRACGNGVHPLASALAFCSLWADLHAREGG
ncbi:MAG: DNA cytosine methyltransferase, partial [Armatimonadetes bacterium]|nr:DNA cytosine methyltransferase [Armatimonadota bacterium]